ncbi:MAG: hypothetical protein ACE5GS_15185 [Kiloniellaceae bacterium]
MAEPLLDLSTAIERPTVLIDGASYEILCPDELSILDLQRLMADGRKIDAIVRKDELSDEDVATLSRLLATLSERILVGAPADVRARLSDQQRLRVAEVFTQLPGWHARARPATGAQSPIPEPDPRTGARPSPGYSGSTAARPDGGSPKLPSTSSGPTS